MVKDWSNGRREREAKPERVLQELLRSPASVLHDKGVTRRVRGREPLGK